MKILKISFLNINSLKGHHEIDFECEPFAGSALFAITGPTGSGKSSILDVIALALFNQAPRLGKISKNEILTKGAILTRNQKEAIAQVDYQCQKGRFRSIWSISTNRNNKLRDYEMKLFDLGTQRQMDLKKSDVPARNEELIGLNYDQFIKSVLLAQGDFAQFLKEKKEERGELLEKITGTGIYRKLGMRAFQKRKEESAAIEQQLAEIEMLGKNLLPEPVFEELQTTLREKEKSCEPLEKAIVKLEEHLRLKQQISEYSRQLEGYEKQKNAKAAELSSFELEQGEVLRRHEQVHLLGEDLRKWKQLGQDCRDLLAEWETIAEKEKQNRAQRSKCLESIQAFLQSDTTEEQVESDLEKFSAKVKKLQDQRDDYLQQYRHLLDKFRLETRNTGFELGNDLEEGQQELSRYIGRQQEDLHKLKQKLRDMDLEAIPGQREHLLQGLENLRQVQQQTLLLEQLSTSHTKAKKELNELGKELHKLPAEIELAKAQASGLEERLARLELQRQNELLRKNFEQHRADLKEGEACPLCGALEHPYAVELPPSEDQLQEKIGQTKAQWEHLKKDLASRESKYSQFLDLEKKLKQETASGAEEIQAKEQLLKKKFPDIMAKSMQELETLHQESLLRLEQLDRYQETRLRLDSLAKGEQLLTELRSVLELGRRTKQDLQKIYDGLDVHQDCRDFHRSWLGFQHHHQSLNGLVRDLREKLDLRKKELDQLETGLSSHVKEASCRDISEALERLLPEQKYSELRKKRETLQGESSRILAAMETLQYQLDNLRKKEADLPADQLEQELQGVRSDLKEAHSTCEELRRKLRNQEEFHRQIDDLQKQIAQKQTETRRWELLNQLIGDATGKRFNDFAQDLNLSQLLFLANQRLKGLSDRYKLDKPREEEDNGLVAIDEYMGGQRRSVKTLSGGETFILSLAMALALSDLASRNVEINSLFIDEGFGTLDPETLDQTLDTLEKLQAASSKSIGIISHVSSLKERIGIQIQLEKNGQGYSSLRLKAK